MEKIKFIRFGGLSPQKQTHRRELFKENNISYHIAPRKKGIYAFPHGYVETFLLGATYHPSNPSGKSAWLRDENGNKIEDTRDFTYTDGKEISIIPDNIKRAMKIVGTKSNMVWSVKDTELTCNDECENCKFDKCIHESNKHYLVYLKKPRVFEYCGDLWCHFKDVAKPEEIIEEFLTWIKVDYFTYVRLFDRMKIMDLKSLNKVFGYNPLNKDPYKKPGITYSKDHLEVFIEKIK